MPPDSDMHVLFVCSWYPDAHDSTLGIFVKRHAAALSDFCKVSVVSFKNGTQEGIHLSEESGIFLVSISYTKALGWKDQCKQFFRRNALFSSALTQITEIRGRVDLVQLNVVFPAVMWIYLKLVEMKQPLVIAEHWSGYLPEDGRYRGLLMHFFTYSAVRRASLVLCVSKSQQSAMRHHGLKSEYGYLPNVADDSIFCLLPGTENREGTWIHVSNLDPFEKNTSFLLRLFAKFREQGKVKKMIVCGGTPDRVQEFRQLVLDSNLEASIVLTGNISPGELNSRMNQASIFLLSSHFEGQPCVIPEAMLTGLKVVAPAVGDIPHLLAEGRGFLFKRNDYEDAHGAIDRALAGSIHPDTIAFVKQNYTPASVGGYLFSHYQKLLLTHRG